MRYKILQDWLTRVRLFFVHSFISAPTVRRFCVTISSWHPKRDAMSAADTETDAHLGRQQTDSKNPDVYQPSGRRLENKKQRRRLPDAWQTSGRRTNNTDVHQMSGRRLVVKKQYQTSTRCLVDVWYTTNNTDVYQMSGRRLVDNKQHRCLPDVW